MQKALNQQGRVRFRNLKVMNNIGIKIAVMAEAGCGQNFQKEIVHVLPFVRDGVQADFVETVRDRRSVRVFSAMDDFPFHGASRTRTINH